MYHQFRYFFTSNYYHRYR